VSTTSIVTSAGLALEVGEADPEADGPLLHHAFDRLLEAGEGYPQAGPVPYDEFREYWMDGKTAVVAAWGPDRSLVGSYFLKPNGYGRAAHVANAGYFVVPEWRGQGAGEALVVESMERARSLGFDALQFNFVFESNPARSLYERLGFREVGLVPDVIDGEAVCIYWRKLDQEHA
jgi:ribosomal protein S18 acetylase RimI-like enzyme